MEKYNNYIDNCVLKKNRHIEIIKLTKLLINTSNELEVIKFMSNKLIDIFCTRVNNLNNILDIENDFEKANKMVTKISLLCDCILDLGKPRFKKLCVEML